MTMDQSERLSLNEHGICSTGNDTFICYICDRIVYTTESAIKHITTLNHTESLNLFDKYFLRDNTQVVCIKCNIRYGWWDVHSHALIHKITPWCKVSDIYKHYYNNFLITHKDILYCYLCKSTLSPPTWRSALNHIHNDIHISRLPINDDTTSIIDVLSESVYKRIVANGIIRQCGSSMPCLVCDCKVPGMKNILEHINGYIHSRRSETFELIENASNDCNINIPVCLKKIIEVHGIQVSKEELYCHLCNVRMTCDKEAEFHLSRHIPSKEITEGIEVNLSLSSKAIIAEGIIKENNDIFHCFICGCIVSDIQNIPNHIKGENHQKLRSICKAKDVMHDTRQCHSESLDKNIPIGIIQKDDVTFFCIFCNCTMNGTKTVMDHVDGSRHNRSKKQLFADDAIEKCSLFIPDYLKPIIKSDEIAVFTDMLYCHRCNVKMTNDGAVDSHLLRHVRRNKTNCNQLPETTSTMPLNGGMKSGSALPVCTKMASAQNKGSVLDNTPIGKGETNFNVGKTIEVLDRHKVLNNGQEKNASKQNETDFNTAGAGSASLNANDSLNINIVNVVPISIENNKSPYENHTNCTISMVEELDWMKYVPQIQFNEKPYCSICNEYITKNEVRNHLKAHASLLSVSVKLEKSNGPTGISEIDEKNTAQDISTKICGMESIHSIKTFLDISKIPMAVHNTIIRKVDLDNADIYTIDAEKLRRIKASVQLTFFKSCQCIHCMICKADLPERSNNFQCYYEHINSKEHLAHLHKYEEDHRKFTKIETSTALEVLHEGLQTNDVNSMGHCLLCETHVDYDENAINEHIRLETHRTTHAKWKEICNNLLKDILMLVEHSWYTIHKFYCQLCSTTFMSEIYFKQHLTSTSHSQVCVKQNLNRKDLTFDFCAPCGLLWFGKLDFYSEHCESVLHMFPVIYNQNATKKLPKKAHSLLTRHEKYVEEYVSCSDNVFLLDRHKEWLLLHDLENTVNVCFKVAKAYPFGSRVSDVGMPNSDIDVFLDIGDKYNGGNPSDNQGLLEMINFFLRRSADKWKVKEVILTSRIPIIKVWHIPTQLNCDISCTNGLGVENTRLLKQFNVSYPNCRKLILFLKQWLCECDLLGSYVITTYAVTWCVIFYLQTLSILPSVTSLIQKKNESKRIDGWETGVSYNFSSRKTNHSFKELLLGFFNFYVNFDFRANIICPLLGMPVKKERFDNILQLPIEMATYVHYMRTSVKPKPFYVTPMCIQDPFDLSHNLTKAIKKDILNDFRILCAKSADVLTGVSSPIQ